MSDARDSSSTECGARWNAGKCWLESGWQGVAAAGILAAKHFNERNGAYVSPFGSEKLLQCDKRISLVVADTESVPVNGLSAFIASAIDQQTPTQIVIGAARSAVSEPLASITGLLHIPQAGYPFVQKPPFAKPLPAFCCMLAMKAVSTTVFPSTKCLLMGIV
eukprot:6204179-Pleurochrysis_carterae.AAC.1